MPSSSFLRDAMLAGNDDLCYYLDKIKIISKRKYKFVHNDFPMEKLKEHCIVANLLTIKDLSKKWGYETRLEIVGPSPIALRLLNENENKLGYHRVSYLEVAKDIGFDDVFTARDFLNFHKEYVYRRWGREADIVEINKIFANWNSYCKYWYDNPNPDKNIIGSYTAYHGSKFQYVFYARNSKVTGLPSAHYEWRLKGTKAVFQQTGIRNVSDLIDFNLDIFYEETTDRLIDLVELDRFKLGKWLVDNTRRRKFSQRERHSMESKVQQFMMNNNIMSFSDLVTYFKEVKAGVRKSRRPGRQPKHIEKIQKIRNYYWFAKK